MACDHTSSEPAQSGNRTRWVGSSRRNPCPVCGRTRDDKCRRNADTIACYRGTDHGPPDGLHLGDVLTLAGAPWAVVNLAGGFARNSLILRPHTGRRPPPPADQLRRRRLDGQLHRAFASVRRMVHASLAVRDLHHLTPDELRAARAIHTATLCDLHNLRPLAGGHARLIRAIDHWLTLVTLQAEDFNRFEVVHLGTRQEVAA